MVHVRDAQIIDQRHGSDARNAWLTSEMDGAANRTRPPGPAISSAARSARPRRGSSPSAGRADAPCPFCASANVATVASRKPQPYRCRERACRKSFSVKTGTLLHSSNLPLRKWAIAVFLYSTNLKGVSSMKLHRDLGISQKW